MPVEGKRKYSFYLDEENTEYVKSFLESTRNKRGLSGLIDDHMKTVSLTLKASKYSPGEKLGIAKILKIFRNGLKQEVV